MKILLHTLEPLFMHFTLNEITILTLSSSLNKFVSKSSKIVCTCIPPNEIATLIQNKLNMNQNSLNCTSFPEVKHFMGFMPIHISE